MSTNGPSTRRQFLRVAVLGTVGSALLAACSQPAPAPSPAAKPAEGAQPSTPAAPAAQPAASPAAAQPAASPAAAGAASPAAQSAPASSAAASKPVTTGQKIVAASYTGPWEEGLKAGVIPCYKAKTGGDVELLLGATASEFVQKVMATRDKPAVDVILGADTEVFQILELGIVEPLDVKKMPGLNDIFPYFTEPYGGYAFGFDGGGFGIAYNSDRIKNPPASWIEFTERVAKGEFGKAVMYPHITNANAQPVNWLINRELGGSTTDSAPFFKRITEMKPNILKFYASSTEPGSALTRGEVDISVWTDARTFGLQLQGAKNIQYKVPAPGTPALTLTMMKVKNGSEAAWDYLNCACDPNAQAQWNKFFPGYYMSNKNIQYPPESMAKQDPSSLDRTFKNFIFPPWKDLAKAWPAWVDAWSKQVGA